MKTWPMTLNDGSEHRVTMCGAAEGVLWIYLVNSTMQEALPIFSDPEKTSVITAYGDVVHENYITLIHLSVEQDGLVRIALRKGI